MTASHGSDPNAELFGYQLPFAYPLYVHLVAPPLTDNSPARLVDHQAEFIATASAIVRRITGLDPTYSGEFLKRRYMDDGERRFGAGYWLPAAFIRSRYSPFNPSQIELVATLYFERIISERIGEEDNEAITGLLEQIRGVLREMRVTADVQDLYNPAIRIAPDTPDQPLPDEDRRVSYVLLHNFASATSDPVPPAVISERNNLARALQTTLAQNNFDVEYCVVTRYAGVPGDNSSIFDESEHDKKRAYLVLAMATLNENEPALLSQHLRTTTQIALQKERARVYCHRQPNMTLNLQGFTTRRPRFEFTAVGWSCIPAVVGTKDA